MSILAAAPSPQSGPHYGATLVPSPSLQTSLQFSNHRGLLPVSCQVSGHAAPALPAPPTSTALQGVCVYASVSSSHAQPTPRVPDLGHVLCLSLCVVCISRALYATAVLCLQDRLHESSCVPGPAWELTMVLLTGRILC